MSDEIKMTWRGIFVGLLLFSLYSTTIFGVGYMLGQKNSADYGWRECYEQVTGIFRDVPIKGKK